MVDLSVIKTNHARFAESSFVSTEKEVDFFCERLGIASHRSLDVDY